MFRLCRPILVLAVLVFATACSSSPSGPSSAGATLNVMLTDAPFSGAKALLVTFTEVSAHVSGTGGFTPLPFSGGATSRTCDLMRLTSSATDVLGTGTLTAGHYTQVRLTVSKATLYFDNVSGGATPCAAIAPGGATTDVTIPSGQIILNREFDVSSGGTTTMTVDFDGDQSVHSQGNGSYSMTPVIAIKEVK